MYFKQEHKVSFLHMTYKHLHSLITKTTPLCEQDEITEVEILWKWNMKGVGPRSYIIGKDIFKQIFYLSWLWCPLQLYNMENATFGWTCSLGWVDRSLPHGLSEESWCSPREDPCLEELKVYGHIAGHQVGNAKERAFLENTKEPGLLLTSQQGPLGIPVLSLSLLCRAVASWEMVIFTTAFQFLAIQSGVHSSAACLSPGDIVQMEAPSASHCLSENLLYT